MLEKSAEEKIRMRINKNHDKLYEIADTRDELNRRISVLETDFKYTKREKYRLLVKNSKSEVLELTKDIENIEKEIDIDLRKIGKLFLTMIR